MSTTNSISRLEPLTVSELHISEKMWLRCCQYTTYCAEIANIKSKNIRLPLVRQLRHSMWGQDTQRAVARTRQIPIPFIRKTCVDPSDCHRRSFFSTSYWCNFSHHSSSTEVLDPVDSPMCPVSSLEVCWVQKNIR